MLNRLIKSLAVASLLLLGLSGIPASAGEASQPEKAASETIVQIAVSDPDLSTLVKALTDTNLVKTLEGAGPFTVFAPTNSAFSKLPAGLLDYLLANPSILKQVLLYHVAAGRDVLSPVPLKTLQGELVFPAFRYGTRGLTVTVNNSVVTVKPVDASNGVIYIIESVLLPQY